MYKGGENVLSKETKIISNTSERGEFGGIQTLVLSETRVQSSHILQIFPIDDSHFVSLVCNIVAEMNNRSSLFGCLHLIKLVYVLARMAYQLLSMAYLALVCECRGVCYGLNDCVPPKFIN